MNDKIEYLNKQIADAEELLRNARAELKSLETAKPVTAEDVAKFLNDLTLVGIFSVKDAAQLNLARKFAHDRFFVALGRIQEVTLDLAYFQQGWDDTSGLAFRVSSGNTWDEALAALKAKEEYIRAAMRLGE